MKGGSRRMCINYRKFDELSVKSRYPLPRIDDLFDQLQGATWFSKIDLRSGYHQLKVREEDVHKTVFRTRYGHFEFIGMPGLTNAPTALLDLLNRVCRKMLVRDRIPRQCTDLFGSKEEHVERLRDVLEILRKERLCGDKRGQQRSRPFWRPWNGKVRKKAKKSGTWKSTKQKTLGVREHREVPFGDREMGAELPFKYLSPPSVRYIVEYKITTELLEAFEEPEREFRKRNKNKSRANKVRPRALNFEMGDDAPMWTTRRTAPTVPINPITKSNLAKEIPGKLLHMIKDLTFDGKGDSNPIVHMENFMDVCDLFRTENDRDDEIRLRVFPLTLTGKQKLGYAHWNQELRSKFLSRFFPPSKIDKIRADIRSFRQDDGETISESWERFKKLLNSCPSHGLSKSEQVQTFYSGLAYSSRATLDSSAGGVFMYKTPTEGYKLLEDMLIHNIDWRTDKCLHTPRMAGKILTEFDPSDELAAMKNQHVKFERKMEELIKYVHALQVGCEECKGPHLTKDCPNRPMMTPEEVNYLNRGDYQGRWNNNRNFNPRPPGFFAPNQQNQQTEGEQRVSIEDRLIQFMNAQKKINDEVGSCLRWTDSRRTPNANPSQPKVENANPMLMMTGATSKKAWTDIYNKKYVDSDSGSEPDYATDYHSEGFTISFEHLGIKDPIYLSDDEDEDSKQGGYAEFVIPKENKGKEKEKEKVDEDELTYIAPIKHDPGSYSLPISCAKFKGLALIDMGAALNIMPVCYCRKMGIKKIAPTDYQYRGVNGYMTTPLGIAEAVPIRIGNFVYFTDFIIANLPKDTEIPIILGRAFLHTAQVNVDMRNQVSSLGYGEKRIYFDPNGEAVTHLDEPYEDPSLAYKKSANRPLLPHEQMSQKKTEDYPNPIHQEKANDGSGPSKKEHRKKRGSSAEEPRNEPKTRSSSRPSKK
ncbi:LOW QUALITY PROTEIN: hypothetical protein OSB04_013197 [Centaurea solstitialis]|uniref:Retrotransposon gag domain-containing protein n=1 Tax=Centaurea solstitialis TaxID=347529 RepID=A0AA38TCT2_9ASTR|nr:LOW QUALITY PROTEIN: hypothetical protein OSB04_013197 [Centaurea solstitialis]